MVITRGSKIILPLNWLLCRHWMFVVCSWRKMDCLSQFVSTLCDRGELKTLVSYPYKDMASQEDFRPAVVSILLRKARSVDLTVRNYYDLLYAFHIINNDLLSGERNPTFCGFLACDWLLNCVISQGWVQSSAHSNWNKISYTINMAHHK